MSGLRIALLLIGLVIVVIVALVSYDKLRLRSIDRKRREWPEGQDAHSQEPVLVSRRRPQREPRLPQADGAATTVSSEDSDADGTDAHPELDEFERAATMPLDLDPGLPEELREQRPDEIVDFIARVPGDTPVPRDKVLGIYRQNEYVLDKHRRIFGFNVDSETWRDLDQEPKDGRYGDIELAIQLADCDGPIDESEINKFAQMGLKVADTLVRPIKFSMSFEAGLERAREIDDFCQSYDVLAIVNIVARPGQEFGGTDIARLAAEQSMALGDLNVFHKENRGRGGSRYLYSLANLYKPGEFPVGELDDFSTRGVTLFMNIPTTYDPPKVFDEMMETARALSTGLNGMLTDRDRRPLDEASIKRIGTQVTRIAREMQDKGIAAGSDLALRLF